MPLPSHGQSIVCVWCEFELTNKSAEWNVFLKVSNSRRRWTWFTHVRVAVWSNIIQVFYNKKWSCDHFGGFVWWGIYLALWKYDFYGDSLLPIMTREHFVKWVRWGQLWEWSELASLPLCWKKGTTLIEKSPKTASNRPQTTHKMQWQPHFEVGYFYFNISAHILPFWNIW